LKHTIADWIISKFSKWLLKNEPPRRTYLSDFHRVCDEVRAGDVLLIEGRSRASRIIQYVTLSAWSHAILYIGYLHEIENPETRDLILKHWHKDTPNAQLIIESEIGLGTVVRSLSKYQKDHIRILRPHGLSHADAHRLINFAAKKLGRKYNIRHIFDLARFLFPWTFLPRKWRSSLFQLNALKPTEDICSSMLAEAFDSISFPILPLVVEDDKNNIELIQRNPGLFTPSDFDYSPYFDVIKYPIFKLGKHLSPKDLPWRYGVISDDTGGIRPLNENKASKDDSTK